MTQLHDAFGIYIIILELFIKAQLISYLSSKNFYVEHTTRNLLYKFLWISIQQFSQTVAVEYVLQVLK